MDSPIDHPPEPVVPSEEPKSGGRVIMAIGFGIWVLNGFGGCLWPPYLLAFDLSMTGLLFAVGMRQKIFGVMLSGASGGMALIGLMEEGRMEWLRVWLVR